MSQHLQPNGQPIEDPLDLAVIERLSALTTIPNLAVDAALACRRCTHRGGALIVLRCTCGCGSRKLYLIDERPVGVIDVIYGKAQAKDLALGNKIRQTWDCGRFPWSAESEWPA